MADNKRFDYERSDVQIRLIRWLAGSLAAFILIVPLALPWMFPQSMTRTTPASRPALTSNAPPLEVNPRDSLERLQQGNAQFASGYGWVDRERGTVHIPVDRAIDLLLHKGLPGWPSP